MKKKVCPNFYYLTNEDVDVEKTKFHSKTRIFFSTEKLSFYSFESNISFLPINLHSNVNEIQPTNSLKIMSQINYRCIKRNYSAELFKTQNITNYLKYLEAISKVKVDVLLNIHLILLIRPDFEAFLTVPNSQTSKQKVWKHLITILKELIESDPIILTKSNIIHLIFETQKLMETLKKKDKTLKQVSLEILIGLKKIGRNIHMLGLLSKGNENTKNDDLSQIISATHKKSFPDELNISIFFQYYEKLKFFCNLIENPNYNHKDQILEYCKWKMKNWAVEKRKEKLRNYKEAQIKCKICLKDISCSIFREHSEYCKEKGCFTSNLNKFKKNAVKYITLFQEIRIFLLTKTKIDIKNLRNIKNRYDVSSHTFILKSQTIVPLESWKFIDLEGINAENESIDDGCSMELNPLKVEKAKSITIDVNEASSTLLTLTHKENALKNSILENDCRNISPHYNSTPSSSNSNIRSSCPLIKSNDSHQTTKMSDFAKKLKPGQLFNNNNIKEEEKPIIEKKNTQWKIYNGEDLLKMSKGKVSPGLKESKFKPLRKIDSQKEDEKDDYYQDVIDETELVKKFSEELQEEFTMKKGSISPISPNSNMLEEILKKNLEKAKHKGVLPQLKEKNESFIEFYSDINVNSSGLPSDNSSPKIMSPLVLPPLHMKRKTSESLEMDLIFEKCVKTNEKFNIIEKNREKMFVSDSEESIFNENEKEIKNNQEDNNIQTLDNIEKFGLRNRTKTLLVIGTKSKLKEKDKSFDKIKHKHYTDMLSSENINPMERMKAQKEIYKSQKKLIKKNDDGIQSCQLFTELFRYISENDYVDRLGYKIQKVFFKLDELEKLLPENQQNQKQKISEAKDFLLQYQALGEKIQRVSHLLYKLQADLLKGQDSKVQRENVRKSLIKKDKKQNSDSVEVLKRSHYTEKNDKMDLKIRVSSKTHKTQTNIKNFKESLHSACILSNNISGHSTPLNHFKFPELARGMSNNPTKTNLDSSLTIKNIEKLSDINASLPSPFIKKKSIRSQSSLDITHSKELKDEMLLCRQESIKSLKRNITSLSLVPDTEKANDKERSGEIDSEIKNVISIEKIKNPTADVINNNNGFRQFQSTQLINNNNEHQNNDDTENSKINSPPKIVFSRSMKRSNTYNEIQIKFNRNNHKKDRSNKDKESSKYMAVLDLFKKVHKLDNVPNQSHNAKKMSINKRRNHGVKQSPLQNILRRSSVDVLSPLTSPDNIHKNANPKAKIRKEIYSDGNSPELKKIEENAISHEKNLNTIGTILTIPSKIDMNIPSQSKIMLDRLTKGEIASSSSDSQEESFVLQEEDYFKGYYSDSYMPSQQVSSMNLNIKEKNEIGIDNFEFINLIGKGAFGRVYLVKRKQTGDQYAMKIINTMDNMNKNKYLSLKNESKVFDLVYSDFVVKALFKFSHEKFYCFVMEYMYGGDFNKILQKYQSLDNHTAKFYIAELVLAVEHLHNLGIVHRDLKPDNILLDVKGHIKLTDFGLSEVAIATLTKHKKPPALSREEKFKNFFQKLNIDGDYMIDNKINYKIDMIKSQNMETINAEDNTLETDSPTRNKSIKKVNKNMHRIIGTPDYIAPEIINGNGSLNHPCIDWWSVGVILFEFLTGIPPFNDDTPEKIFENISNLRIEWDQIMIGYEDDQMTPEAADLIKKLLNLDPEKRLGSKGVDEIKTHDFFHGTDWNNLIKSEPPIIPEIILEDEKKGKNEIAEKDPFLKQVVSTQQKVNEEENKNFFEEDDEIHVRYDLLEKENYLTLEKNFSKMEEKTIKEETSSLSYKSSLNREKVQEKKSVAVMSQPDLNLLLKNSID